MNELALFAGAGGGILGGHLLGWRCVCAVEYDHYARSVLMARQNDGCFPAFPIWDDVRTFDGRPWRGRVDVVSGGFPCQDISCAGKGAGITGERSGLWGEMARIIGEVRPRFVWVENSPMLVHRGLAVVLGDLAALGFDARWGVVGAHHAAAPHKRDRIWLLGWDANRINDDTQPRVRETVNAHAGGIGEGMADASSCRFQGRDICNGMHGQASAERRSESMRGGDGVAAEMADAEGEFSRPRLCGSSAGTGHQFADGRSHVPDPVCIGGPTGVSESDKWQARDAAVAVDGGAGRTSAAGWWGSEPDVGRVAHGVAARVDRLRCIGNGQVPRVVQQAWEELTR